MSTLSIDHLCRYAASRSLFAPTTLARAIRQLGFVQADPIRSPARAQDLILRHRVKGYRAGELERSYAQLDVEEDLFVNYGFVPRAIHHLMHPREPRTRWPKARWTQAQAVLEFVRERGTVHPREVDAQFAHGRVRNWFGGSSNASTQLLDGMHYRGLLRIAGRASGVRLYAAREPHAPAPDPHAAMDVMVDVIVAQYAPLPARSLAELVGHLRDAVPQWDGLRRPAIARAMARLPSAAVDGVVWVWPAGEDPASPRHRSGDAVRLLAPFDPVVWDRRRFELFWGWAYRFEAYTPAAKRRWGYYAMPLWWAGQVIGWGNVRAGAHGLTADFGYVAGRAPRSPVFRRELDAEMQRLAEFLGAA
jgi:uncharacterized protein